MKKQITLCLLLSLSTGSVPSICRTMAHNLYSQAAPSQAYFLLADEIADLFQQLEKLPAAQANVLLRQKAPSLQARIKQVQPAYKKYLKSLSASSLQAENDRVAASHWGKYFARMEAGGLDAVPRIKALLNPGNPSGQTILDLMGVFNGI